VPRASDLEARDVINILDGRRLGSIVDVEFSLETGRIIAIVVPGAAKVLGLFGRDSEIVIPWEKIKKIGTDVILVELPEFPHASYV
jgi:YlmC/YmxH family sporulation protein